MLLALSGTLTAAGVEHHRCFEAVSDSAYFAHWQANLVRRDTIPHEFVHSWNGKHRRGADSCSASFDRPIRNDLLWVYEEQTQYWTNVLCARSGLWSLEDTLGALALTAARYDVRPGSRWRPLLDTTRGPIIAARGPLPWPSWQRSEDYYAEGALLWLDVDTRLREPVIRAERAARDDASRNDCRRCGFLHVGGRGRRDPLGGSWWKIRLCFSSSAWPSPAYLANGSVGGCGCRPSSLC